jgi:hypothetical protein
MALRYAVATGNWSNTATWDGGTLPTAADDVFSNSFTVTIDGTFTVLSIRNTSNAVLPVIAAGGQFRYANGGNLTCTATQSMFVPSVTPVLEMTLASPNTATFNGSVLTLLSGSGPAIRNSNTGTLNLNGNYNLDGPAFTIRNLIALTSTGTINIVGDVSSTSTGTTGQNNTIYITGAGTVNITGNVTGGGSTTNSHSTIITTVGATINITGNVSSNTAAAINLPNSTALTIIGNVTANGGNPTINNATTAATISVTGIITASSTAPAIYAITGTFSSGPYVKVSGNVVNSTNNMAIVAPRVTIDTNTSSWLFQISMGGNRTLYAAGVALGNPATSNVRFGTTYGASSELTGTLRVPTAANVLSGVLVDNTTGTLLMTPADFWNYLIASGFTADSIGDRLQNVATVATTGGQIASYNI